MTRSIGSVTLLATKLHRPSTPPKRVRRPRLIQRLDEGLEAGRQVTLMSAPAGFGKTTCVSAWLDGLDCPVAWLSLDAADDDPGRFFTYFVAALQKVDARLGREIEGILRAGQLPTAEAIHTALINDALELPGRFVLVLDDLQVIQDRFILQVLERLVASLPPAFHLVLITREDPSLPLARLRANNQMTEIRAGDLRFTDHEASRFLDEVMGLALSQADVDVLDDKTEGWIVGLQLAGLSVRDRADPSAFIATLSGSHRSILSYLTEEVLGRQPQEIQQFLLQTSILDKLSGDLCNAVTGRTDGQVMLEHVFNANLFLIPLDDEQQWYRYHHLFADLLRNRQNALQTGQAAELHRRASHWYAQAGMTNEAVQHALAAPDYAMATHLVEGHAMGMALQGYVKTVAGWMQAIPPEWSSSPRATMAFVWMHFVRGTMAQATPYLERLQTIFSATETSEKEDPSLQAQWLALQPTVLMAQGKPAESLSRATQALQIIPETDHLVRSLIHLGLAGAYQQMADYAHAVEAYQMMARHGQAAGNLVIETMGQAGLAGMAMRMGRLHLAFEIASQAVERIERSGSLPPISATVYGQLGEVHYQWNQLERAHRHFQRATQVSALSGYNDAQTSYLVRLSRLHQTEGDLESAAREIRKAVDLLQAGAAAWMRSEVISQQVRVYLARDNPAAAEAVLAKSAVSVEDEVTQRTDAIHLAYVRWMLHLGQEQQASELARRIIASAQAGQRMDTVLKASILGALALSSSGHTKGSLEMLEQAIGLAEPEGYVRIFLEEGAPMAALLRRAQEQGLRRNYVDSLLALFSAPTTGATLPPDSAGLIEPLTAREMEVLRLIREGCSNQEIAERLVITLHTVKKHNSNIFGKLGANSRTQALDRAHQLGLL